MTTTATRTTQAHENPIKDVHTYWKVSGMGLAAIAILGIIVNILFGNQQGIPGFLVFDWTHNIVHVALAALALGVGFGNVNLAIARPLALVVGIVYLALGVVGFIAGNLFSFMGLHLQFGENLVHLLIGAWGVFVAMAN